LKGILTDQYINVGGCPSVAVHIRRHGAGYGE
jgi:hypothetical protein